MFEVREFKNNKKGKALYETLNLWDALHVAIKYRKQGHEVVLTERKNKDATNRQMARLLGII